MILNRRLLLLRLAAGLQLVEHERDYLDCWDLHEKKEAQVFHLHTPKVAGCSVVQDLSDMVGRENIFSDEVCFSYSFRGTYNYTVAMVREPRDHVYSMYQFCHMAVDPGYRVMTGRRHGLEGQENYKLPGSFEEWIEEWYLRPRFGNYDIYEDEEFCYCPYNLQSSHFVCKSESSAKYCHASADVHQAVANLESASMVGIEEAYHESICLFHARLLGSLPSHCACESEAWQRYVETEIRHRHGDEAYGSVLLSSAETLRKVDEMTRDDRALYAAAVRRFLRDLEGLEQSQGVRVLCEAQRQALQERARAEEIVA